MRLPRSGGGPVQVEGIACQDAGVHRPQKGMHAVADLFEIMGRGVEQPALAAKLHRMSASSIALRRREGRTSSVRASAAVVTFRSRSASRRASKAASLADQALGSGRQSTTVRAGEVIRAGTSSNFVSWTPQVQAAPLKRSRRTPTLVRAGGFALCGMAIQTW